MIHNVNSMKNGFRRPNNFFRCSKYLEEQIDAHRKSRRPFQLSSVPPRRLGASSQKGGPWAAQARHRAAEHGSEAAGAGNTQLGQTVCSWLIMNGFGRGRYMGSQRVGVRPGDWTGLNWSGTQSALPGVTALRPLPGGVAAPGLYPRVTVPQHTLQVHPASRAVPVWRWGAVAVLWQETLLEVIGWRSWGALPALGVAV